MNKLFDREDFIEYLQDTLCIKLNDGLTGCDDDCDACLLYYKNLDKFKKWLKSKIVEE